MIAFVFPGQGSQVRGMGKGLFGEVPEYAAIEDEADALLGQSLRALCLHDPSDLLKQTQYTQPCLYVVNALHYYKAIEQGARPEFVAGHSLGEFNALLAAGAVDFITGLQLVRKRGELMSQAHGGAMAAAIGLSHDKIADVLCGNGLTTLDIASFNSPNQTVVAGPESDVARAGPLLEQAGAAMYVPLQVSAAFHSRYLEKAARAYADFLVPMTFSAPKVTVIANATGEPYPTEDFAAAVKSLLVRQMTSPVRWTQTVQYLIRRGVTEFRELGPGTALTRLIRQIRS